MGLMETNGRDRQMDIIHPLERALCRSRNTNISDTVTHMQFETDRCRLATPGWGGRANISRDPPDREDDAIVISY